MVDFITTSKNGNPEKSYLRSQDVLQEFKFENVVSLIKSALFKLVNAS